MSETLLTLTLWCAKAALISPRTDFDLDLSCTHSEWTDNFPYDFRDERMMRELKDMTQRLLALNASLRKDVTMLNHNLLSKLSSLQKYEDLLARINAEVAQRLLNIMPTVSQRPASP